jgi:iron complex outermembrane receptor protein
MPTPGSIGPGSLRISLTTLLLLGPIQTSVAQEPVRPDTTRRDSAKVTLPEIIVTVTRTEEALSRVPAGIAVLDRDAVRRGQATRGPDEALNNIPGVYVSSRRDPRISIRGFGSRANFGIRGVKVLLDGIPQTLPDGQSQLDNIEPAAPTGSRCCGLAAFLRKRLEESLFTEALGPEPVGATIRTEAVGRLFKILGYVTGRSGPVDGGVTVSAYGDGRMHSAAEPPS